MNLIRWEPFSGMDEMFNPVPEPVCALSALCRIG